MRDRERILSSLEAVYREAFDEARASDDVNRARELDFDFQREQLRLEVLLDIRDLLATPPTPAPEAGDPVGGLIDKAQALKKLTRFT